MTGISASAVTAYTAHREWASRPPDERFASVHALYETARARRQRLAERTIETGQFRTEAVAEDAPVEVAEEAVTEAAGELAESVPEDAVSEEAAPVEEAEVGEQSGTIEDAGTPQNQSDTTSSPEHPADDGDK